MPEMVVIPAGSVLVGSTAAETTREGRAEAQAANERPQRMVTFSRQFAVAKHLVTRREFAVFVTETSRDMTECLIARDGRWSDGPLSDASFRKPSFRQRDDEPVVCVNWEDANAYTAWLSQRTGAQYRLLTEAEWEYAARGGTTTARWWGDDIADICSRVNGGDRSYARVMPADTTANAACADGFAHTSPVGHFRPNPFGLHDMLGNAWQWVSDCFAAKPGMLSPETPCKARSIRGGSWHNGTAVLRAATRFSLPPQMRSSSLGFRVMREMD